MRRYEAEREPNTRGKFPTLLDKELEVFTSHFVYKIQQTYVQSFTLYHYERVEDGG